MIGGLAIAVTVVSFSSGGDPGIGRGFAELLRLDLARIPGLQVGPVVKAGPLERNTLDGRAAIASRHRATFVITGSIETNGELRADLVLSDEHGQEVALIERTAPRAEFVAVEKAILEEIIELTGAQVDLQTLSDLLFTSPTESWDAFAAYSGGLAALEEGSPAVAAQRFRSAVSHDPSFQLAKERVVRAEVTPDPHVAILSECPDERQRPKKFVHTEDSLASFALRLMVLEDEDRHCQRFEEMLAHLERARWKVRVPERRAFDEAITRRARRRGFDRVPDVDLSRGRIFSSTVHFLFDGELDHPYRSANGLLASMRRCLSPASQLAELDRLLERAESFGVQTAAYTERPTFTLRQGLELAWAETHASALGSGDALLRRLAALRSTATTPVLMRALEDRSRAITKLARETDVHRERRRGRAPLRLRATVHALAEGDRTVVSAKTPICAHLVEAYRPLARQWVEDELRITTQLRENREDHLDGSALLYGPLADMGCLADEPGRFTGSEDVARFLIDIQRLAREGRASRRECRAVFNGLARDVAGIRPDASPRIVRAMLEIYHLGLVRRRCVTDEPRIVATAP